MSKQRIAIVGLGMAVTPHAKALRDLSDRVEVVHAFSPTAARREAFAQHFDFPLAESYETILQDASVEAVMVLTPPNTHKDLAEQAIRAGKHVLLEKPVEISTARAAALVAEAEAAGLTLGIVFQNRFRPACLTLKALLDDGRLGRIVGVSARTYNWRPQSYYDQPGRGTLARDGGGVLLTQAIHTLDLMVWLAGLPAEVSAHATTSVIHRMETEDIAAATMRFSSGAVGTISATTSAYPGFPERIEIIAEHGLAVLDGTVLKVSFHDGETIETGDTAMSGGNGADPMAFPHDYHMALIEDFLDALRDGRPPMIPGSAALRVHRLIDALLASRGTPVAVA